MIAEGCQQAIDMGRRRIGERFDDHLQFVRDREAAGKPIKHINRVYGFPVITRQEAELMIPLPADLEKSAKNKFTVTYEMPEAWAVGQPAIVPKASPAPKTGQLSLFD
jgi:hypothetical protein